MYDFIAVTDSKEKTEVVFAYSEPKENIRKETFLYEKAYKAYRVIRITTSGTEEGKYGCMLPPMPILSHKHSKVQSQR